MFTAKKYHLPAMHFMLKMRLPAFAGWFLGWLLLAAQLFFVDSFDLSFGFDFGFDLSCFAIVLAMVIAVSASPFLEDKFTVIMDRLNLAESTWKSRCKAIAKQYNLTPRESEVLVHLSHGRNAAYIQEKLCISSHTARTHISHIYAKTMVGTQHELMDLIENLSLD
jgi:DNA-binding CsgD family transcriptional regulator